MIAASKSGKREAFSLTTAARTVNRPTESERSLQPMFGIGHGKGKHPITNVIAAAKWLQQNNFGN
jgi:hypothetical protein